MNKLLCIILLTIIALSSIALSAYSITVFRPSGEPYLMNECFEGFDPNNTSHIHQAGPPKGKRGFPISWSSNKTCVYPKHSPQDINYGLFALNTAIIAGAITLAMYPLFRKLLSKKVTQKPRKNR